MKVKDVHFRIFLPFILSLMMGYSLLELSINAIEYILPGLVLITSILYLVFINKLEKKTTMYEHILVILFSIITITLAVLNIIKY